MPPQNIKIWSEHQTLTSRWIRGHGRRCGTASWRWTWGTREFHLWTCAFVILEETYFCLWTWVDVVLEQTYFLRWVFVWHQQLVSDNMELWRRDLALEEELKQKRPILGYWFRTEFKIWEKILSDISTIRLCNLWIPGYVGPDLPGWEEKCIVF